MRYCVTANALTNCTDNCKECAREAYNDLKAQLEKAEYISEEGIKRHVNDDTIDMLRKYGFIEVCGVIDGEKIYAL